MAMKREGVNDNGEREGFERGEEVERGMVREGGRETEPS